MDRIAEIMERRKEALRDLGAPMIASPYNLRLPYSVIDKDVMYLLNRIVSLEKAYERIYNAFDAACKYCEWKKSGKSCLDAECQKALYKMEGE